MSTTQAHNVSCGTQTDAENHLPNNWNKASHLQPTEVREWSNGRSCAEQTCECRVHGWTVRVEQYTASPRDTSLKLYSKQIIVSNTLSSKVSPVF